MLYKSPAPNITYAWLSSHRKRVVYEDKFDTLKPWKINFLVQKPKFDFAFLNIYIENVEIIRYTNRKHKYTYACTPIV